MLVLFIVSVLFQVSTTHLPSVNSPHCNEFVSIVMHLRCKFPISAYFVACLQFFLYIGDFYNEELSDLYSLPNTVRVVKSRRMR